MIAEVLGGALGDVLGGVLLVGVLGVIVVEVLDGSHLRQRKGALWVMPGSR